MNKSRIWISAPHMEELELQNIQEAFKSNWIAPAGPFVEKFEKSVAKLINVANGIALNSGTSAIHIALQSIGVSKDDVVLCQSFTFVASVNPVIYLGATPVFIDSEVSTWCICPIALENAIIDLKEKGINPKAIITVDAYGMPAKYDALLKISENYKIPLIEDAASAIGSHINGKMCGSFGKVGVFSFNGNKIITTSGGGVLVSDSEKIVSKAKYLSSQARELMPHYEHKEIGYNYRLSNVLAAIGIGQLEVLNNRIMTRRLIFEYYKNLFQAIDGVSFLNEPTGYFSNRWLTCILIDPKESSGITREDLRLAFEKENIESRPLWKPMHLQPVFKDFPFYGDKLSETLFDKGLCLPSGSNMTNDDKQRISKVIKNLFKI